MITDQIGLHSVLLPLLIDIIYRFGQAKKRSSHFFFHTSQGHNTLPWPVLEPESSNSEPSALTTGLLDKAVALACPWYSWPRMLKVAPCMVVQSYGRTVVQSYGHTVVQLYCHTSKFFWLNGFLLFCIFMGLNYAFGNVSVKPGLPWIDFFLHEKLVIRYTLEWDQT